MGEGVCIGQMWGEEEGGQRGERVGAEGARGLAEGERPMQKWCSWRWQTFVVSF